MRKGKEDVDSSNELERQRFFRGRSRKAIEPPASAFLAYRA